MVLVTIIVPIYGMPSYLPRCFESILTQTVTDWKAILVDDGSPDNSGEICDEWAKKDNRFTVIHKPNGGVCSARNAGIKAADTPYVMLMDQDDLIAPTMLQQLLDAPQLYPDSFVMSLHTETRDELPSDYAPNANIKLYKTRKAANLYNEAPFPPPWAKLYKKELLTDVLFNEVIRDGYEDRPFMQHYLDAHWHKNPHAPCAVVQLPLYFWERENVGSVSQSGHQPLKPWHMDMFDGFLQDCIQTYNCPLLTLQFYMLEYIQTIAFSLSCLPDHEQQSALETISKTDAYARMLHWFEQARFYSVFYIPFKLKNSRLIVRLSEGRLRNDAFYWRCYKLFRIFHPTWMVWKDIASIPQAE